MIAAATVTMVLMLASSVAGQGSCTKYANAPFISLAGNDNKVYVVVKVLPEHLPTSNAHSLAPTAADNTVTIMVACAFDKMATAAKQAGVTVTITSGFRSLARQQYFYDCYTTGSCNGGNMAARPGSSIYGTANILGLNADCGRQTGAKPECPSSPVYQWLSSNAHKFGFVRQNQAEPWVWEYKGSNAQRTSFT